MKKLFTLVALMMCFLGAKAETKVDYEVDLSTATSWAHGWLNESEHLVFEEGVGLHFTSTEAQEQFYSFQYQIFPGISGLDNDASYTITLKIKGTVAQEIHASFSGSNTPGMIPITTDWEDVVLENCVNDPNAPYFANSGCLLIQPGDYVGEFWISYIKVTHEEKAPTRPVEWVEQIANGGADTAWPEWALQEEGGINANWRGDRTGEICAWGLTMGRNIDDQCPSDISGDSFRARPFPADIEDDPADPTNKVFAVHVTEIGEIDNEASIAWSNQFWIQSPKVWKAGTKAKISFRYKAEKAASGVASQCHQIYPSIYLNGNGVGTLAFTTEWQETEATVDVGGGASIAFNLTNEFREPNVYYFDDLSWKIMKLDDGFFVAYANKETGIEYDYDNAIEFTQDPNDPEVIVATVGTVGKQDTWVNELMISTVRGENAAFKGATIKPSGTIKGKDDENWQLYADGSQYKIELPAAGVWQISIAPADKQILFMQIEGEEIVEKEAVDIVTNDQEIVIEGVERDDLKDNTNNDGTIAVREDADDPEGVTTGGEGHEGQTWDNQFFIVANRVLKAKEETVLEFDYVATTESAFATGTHAAPGDYRKNALNDADYKFTTEEQHLKVDYIVPDKTWGGDDITDAQSISFDLAIVKAAATYTIKNVKWYLKGDENEEGKTYENLINATGTDNFIVKIGAGTSPRPYGTDGIKNIVSKKTASDATFNLAGQRVSKNYKGIVVKSGKKVVKK